MNKSTVDLFIDIYIYIWQERERERERESEREREKKRERERRESEREREREKERDRERERGEKTRRRTRRRVETLWKAGGAYSRKPARVQEVAIRSPRFQSGLAPRDRVLLHMEYAALC